MGKRHASTARRTEFANRRILLVDDDMKMRDDMARVLENAFPGATIATAASGQAALASFRREHADVVVSDFRMPRMNGVEVLSAVRNIDPQARRILITAYPDFELAQHALEEARISKFFVKPVDPDQLVEGVAAQLRQRAIARERDETIVHSPDAQSRERRTRQVASLRRRPELR